MRDAFHDRLDALEATIQEEGDYVLRALTGALQALETSDAQLADDVIAFDDEVDRRHEQILDAIHQLLARQAPVAGDLRLLLALLHINLHLERMGDYCATIAKLSKLVLGLHPDPLLADGLDEMGERAQEMLRLAMSSLQRRDPDAARRLVELDDLLDQANRRVSDHVLRLPSDDGSHEWGLRMILVSRALERIGDHAVDIGEQTAFVAAGEIRRLADASHSRPAAR
jgi:phosphate transport system protein